MICFLPSGIIQIKENICSCANGINGKFIDCEYQPESQISSKEITSDDESEDDYKFDEDFDDDSAAQQELYNQQLRDDCIFELLQKETFIAICSPPMSQELFYLCRVLDFGVALDDLCDKYNHKVPKGTSYIKCQYLERICEKKETCAINFYQILCSFSQQKLCHLWFL